MNFLHLLICGSDSSPSAKTKIARFENLSVRQISPPPLFFVSG